MLLQVLPVKGMDLLGQSASDAGDVFVASSMSDLGIRRLAPLPFAEQASVLADREEFGAALELAALMPSSQVRLLPQSEVLVCAAWSLTL